uniref:Ferritin n=1 Tax=uncultured Elusimicrobia bacterium TaxID=699876 RepID=A0A650EN85_9BACT|nr:ferritin [uncultured Elusimicrobia bacterium]
MGMKGREIVEKAGLDVDQLIKLLNKAYSDEWFAYYQYWVGAKVAEGVLSGPIVVELEEHAKEELHHASRLADRIGELGGTPVLSPEDWYKESNCEYLVPADPEAAVILRQNIASERCAIEVYEKLLEFIDGKDPITEDIIHDILADEVEHEDDLEKLAKALPGGPAKGKGCGCGKK